MSKYETDPEDGLPREIVRPWALDKHWLLAAYVDASRGPRASLKGEPCFVDLYCGPGHICTVPGGHSSDGGALVAVKRSLSPTRGAPSPYHQVFIADLEARNVDACKQRLAPLGIPVHSRVGDAAHTAEEIINLLPRYGLHLAYLDPYALKPMPFSVIRAFSKVPKVDLLIHFSTSDLRRNLDHPDQTVDNFEAVAPGWSKQPAGYSKRELRHRFFAYWSKLVEGCGYHLASKPFHVKNSKKSEIYMLTLASKNSLGPEIWDSLRPHPQRDLL